jgi:hypothetical protein
MKEKYTITLLCGNCGKTRIAHIPCGKTWKEVAKEPGL